MFLELLFTRLPYAVIKKFNEKIADMCKKNAIVFIENGNVNNMDFFRKEYTHYPPVRF